MQSELAELRERLATAERTATRTQRCIAIGGLVCAGLLLIGQAKPESAELRGERLVLTGAEGKERARISTDASGAVALELKDAQGETRATLSVTDAGDCKLRFARSDAELELQLNPGSKALTTPWAGLTMYRKPIAIGLVAMAGGHAQLNLSSDSRPRVSFSVTSGGPTQGRLQSAAGKVVWAGGD